MRNGGAAEEGAGEEAKGGAQRRARRPRTHDRRSARDGGSAARRRLRAHAPAEATSPSFRAMSKNCSSPRPYAPRGTSGTRRSAEATRHADMAPPSSVCSIVLFKASIVGLQLFSFHALSLLSRLIGLFCTVLLVICSSKKRLAATAFDKRACTTIVNNYYVGESDRARCGAALSLRSSYHAPALLSSLIRGRARGLNGPHRRPRPPESTQ